jgi:hypothetical protein
VTESQTFTQTGPGVVQLDRFTEIAGLTKFSYVPPSGWIIEPASGSSLTAWNLPSPQGGIVCTLSFSVAKSDKTASEIALEILKGSSNTNGSRIVFQGKFDNDAGLDAYKVVVAFFGQGNHVQITAYYFQKRGYLIMPAYGRLTELYKEQDAVVDASLRKLRYE